MKIDCPLPPPQSCVDPDTGQLSAAWWACIGAVHERTGGTVGVSSAALDTAIGNEAAVRAAADAAIQAALTAEAAARASGDSAEIAARTAADTYILNYAQGINTLLHETIARGGAPIDSPHFTGAPTAPTPLAGDNDTSIATTAFVQAAVGGGPFAPINNPTFTGIAAAPHFRAILFEVDIVGGPTWTAGVGAPTETRPGGSLYSRMDPAIGATLYVSQGGGVWTPVAGV